ncbi:MAG: putative colanic acid biosynthesis acetyltransferase [Planctomycetaceae bacterium]
MAWYFVSVLFVECAWNPLSSVRVWLLRLFGASIGDGVVIRPNVRVKYPWRLTIGNDCWIGRDVWIDNLDDVVLASDVCISQAAYLCTGSHDHRSATFELQTGPIRVGHGAWICCRAVLLKDVVVMPMEIVSANAVRTSMGNMEGQAPDSSKVPGN